MVKYVTFWMHRYFSIIDWCIKKNSSPYQIDRPYHVAKQYSTVGFLLLNLQYKIKVVRLIPYLCLFCSCTYIYWRILTLGACNSFLVAIVFSMWYWLSGPAVKTPNFDQFDSALLISLRSYGPNLKKLLAKIDA